MAVENKPQHDSSLKSAASDVTKQEQQEGDSSVRKRMMVKWPSTKEKMEDIRRRSSLNEIQISTLWLDYQEFCSLRAEASKQAKQNRNKGYSKLLELPDNEKMAQLKLDLWASRDNLRGLERYVNSEHRQWRDSATRETRHAVLEAQKNAQEDDELDDFADYLAAISCEHSADSKIFAEMIGKADEKAATKSASFGR